MSNCSSSYCSRDRLMEWCSLTNDLMVWFLADVSNIVVNGALMLCVNL